MTENTPNQWQYLNSFVKIESPWLTLIGEHWRDQSGKNLDYWRVEKADSVVILTLQNQQLIFPKPLYRPGLGCATLDFPGGRVPGNQTPLEVVPQILQQELGLNVDVNLDLTLLNELGWAINSSFSNQKLYGVVAEIAPTVSISPEYLGVTYPATPAGIETLLKTLTCLQCRSVLLEWQRQQ